MNHLLAAYTPSFHPADRWLVPQRTCQVYWEWLISNKLDVRNPLTDLVKRILTFVPLVLVTLVSSVIGLIAASAKANE